MKDWDCYAFMVFKQKKEHGMTISLFRVSLSANGGLHSPPPIHSQGNPSLLRQ